MTDGVGGEGGAVAEDDEELDVTVVGLKVADDCSGAAPEVEDCDGVDDAMTEAAEGVLDGDEEWMRWRARTTTREVEWKSVERSARWWYMSYDDGLNTGWWRWSSPGRPRRGNTSVEANSSATSRSLRSGSSSAQSGKMALH